MPESIATEHMNRIFPFAFYDELSEQLGGYVLTNPAFLLHHKSPISPEQRQKLFKESRSEAVLAQLNRYNILEAEPFGELLHLELCTDVKHVDQLLGTTTQRSQVPLSILVGQLYDSSGLPVFSKDVTDETIAQLPEVLWDDPNLLLAVVAFGETETTVGVIRIPEKLEARLFEAAEPNGETAE